MEDKTKTGAVLNSLFISRTIIEACEDIQDRFNLEMPLCRVILLDALIAMLCVEYGIEATGEQLKQALIKHAKAIGNNNIQFFFDKGNLNG